MFQQIVNCLNEWETGSEVKIPFAGDKYESVHGAILALIGQLEQNDYHGAKLQAMLQSVAIDGKYVEFLLASSLH